MLGFTKSSIVLALIFCLAEAAALPASAQLDVDSLVIPGPGLPKPSELGLTVEDLTKPVPELEHLLVRERLEKRFDAQCWRDRKCNFNDANNCFNYLRGLGHTNCVADRRTVGMCQAGPCVWWGRPINGNAGYASSYCEDVAWGGAWVINNCKDSNKLFSGANAANGNGNFIVEIHT
ncbi:hypothetical protein DRE_04150 [Drechslerella stenobrocha 248]|uniref:Uncharacterized protein n=1 Tax=Drechslerella stenobrocha 248 TaxID=1043628 RepID=W7I3A3_9PEZI|nr:hypothetical protein DRE_04150 [Drechslerella stenobrocha 248]